MYLLPCAGRNMQVWTLWFEHTAEQTGQPLPPVQSSPPSFPFIQAGSSQCSLHWGLPWPHWPFTHTGLWELYSLTPPRSASLSSLKHQNHRMLEAGTNLWRSQLQPHCYGRVTQSSLFRAVFSQFLNYLQRQRPHNLSGQHVPVTDHPHGYKTQILSTKQDLCQLIVLFMWWQPQLSLLSSASGEHSPEARTKNEMGSTWSGTRGRSNILHHQIIWTCRSHPLIFSWQVSHQLHSLADI